MDNWFWSGREANILSQADYVSADENICLDVLNRNLLSLHYDRGVDLCWNYFTLVFRVPSIVSDVEFLP